MLPLKHFKNALVATAMMSSLQAATIENGSFEYNSTSSSTIQFNSSAGESGNIKHILDGSTSYSHLTGWDILRPEYWTQSNGTVTRRTNPRQDTTSVWSTTVQSGNVLNGTNVSSLRPNPGVASPNGGNAYFSVYNNTPDPNTGNIGNPPITTTTLRQTVTNLVIGQEYEVSFWHYGFVSTDFGVQDIRWIFEVDNQQILSQQIIDFIPGDYGVTGPYNTPENTFLIGTNGSVPTHIYTNWAQSTATFTATSTSSVFEFVAWMQGGPAQLALDNVTINAIPEPSSALICIALTLGLTASRRKRS